MLLVAEEHHRAVGARGEQLDYSQLQLVEVLHLVYLHPCVALVEGLFGVGVQRVVGEQEQVVEVEQVVLLLIPMVLLRELHLLQQSLYNHAIAVVGCVGSSHIAVGLHIIIYVDHRRRVERPSAHAADALHSLHVVAVDAVGVRPQRLRMPHRYLVHHAFEMEYERVFAATAEIAEHEVFVLASISRKDRHGVLLVDDARLSRYESVRKQKLGTKAVYIAHEHVAHAAVGDIGINALEHSARGSVGEREAQHVGILHALNIVGTAYALCKYLRLAAAGRSKHEMEPALRVDNLALVWVGGECQLKKRLHIYIIKPFENKKYPIKIERVE